MIKDPARPEVVEVHSSEQLEGALQQGAEHEWRIEAHSSSDLWNERPMSQRKYLCPRSSLAITQLAFMRRPCTRTKAV